MKMHLLRAHVQAVGLLILAVLMSVALAAAQTLVPTVYVSTAGGNQILAINGAGSGAGAVSVLCNGGNKFVPEDAVVGPDGLIYVANTTQNQIWRIDPAGILNQKSVPPSCTSGAGTELIYDLKTTTGCTDVSGAGQSSCPSAPEGPSFVSEPNGASPSSLDLVFNTHSSNSARGVWVIRGIASLPIGCAAARNCPAPVRIIQPFSTAGEGIEFDIPGNMLIVDQAGGKVFRAAAPTSPSNFAGTPTTSFISGLTSPVGVAVDTCGDILVTSGLYIQRYNSVTGTAFPDYALFASGNVPRFMEVDSSDKLYVVTAADESGTGGKVWRIDLSASAPGTVGSCALTTPVVPIADLAALKAAKSVANLGSGNALGLGVSATDFTSQTLSFLGPTGEQTFNLGNSTVTVKCDYVASPFYMKITTLKSRPTNSSQPQVTFDSPLQCEGLSGLPSVPVSNPVSLHYSSQHGFSTQYWEQPCTDAACSSPINDTDFNSSVCPDLAVNNFHVEAGYFTLDTINFPGGAHAPTENRTPAQIATDAYPDCFTTQYFGNAGPGVDGGIITRNNSKHVGFTSSVLTENGAITLKQPALSNNPQFNIGTQNISVKFNLNDALTGTPITDAVERLSIIRISHTVNGVTTNELLAQQVVPSNNSNFENFFSGNSAGQYSFGVDTSFFTLGQPKGSTGTYQITIWGNDAQPFTFSIVGTF